MKLENIETFIDKIDSVERIDLSKSTDSAIQQLNTYRNWNSFGLQVEPIIGDNGEEVFWRKDDDKNSRFIGTKALFNNTNAVVRSGRVREAMNAPLLDAQEVRDRIRERGGCSVRDLVEASKKGYMGRAIYNYSDFMYCKHLGKMSNNYLITLRRFPVPCGDHINNTLYDDSDEMKINSHTPDIGRLVTWMGTPGNEMSGILNYSVLMPYAEMSSQVQDMNGTAEDGGLLGSLLNLSNPEYRRGTLAGYAGESSISFTKKLLGYGPMNKIPGVSNIIENLNGPRNTDWNYHIDRSKPYGPVDIINKTHIRKGGQDGGLEFNHDIKLQFDYELRAYDGINGKAAMLDLLANILSVTFTNGRFWGGMIRSNGMAQSSVFTNLPIFKLGEPLTFNKLKDSALDSISQIGASFNNGNNISSVKDLINAISNFASNIGTMLLGGALNALGRPQKQGLDSLLNSNPTGLWHLTVGNPKHPILSMGNMILKSVNIQHYGPLGLDDFPTGIRVDISLTHGMPRDKLRIEHMYGMGDNRIYMPVGKNVMDMYNSSEVIQRGTGLDDQVSDAQLRALSAEIGVSKGPASTSTKSLQQITSGIVQDTINTSKTTKSTSERYKEYFGTDDAKMITIASLEAHMGSSKAKTTQESDRDAKLLKSNQEKNEQ